MTLNKKTEIKTQKEIKRMISGLRRFYSGSDVPRDMELVKEVTIVLDGQKKSSDYVNEEPDLKEAVKMAEKWVAGKIRDQDLFIQIIL